MLDFVIIGLSLHSYGHGYVLLIVAAHCELRFLYVHIPYLIKISTQTSSQNLVFADFVLTGSSGSLSDILVWSGLSD